MAYNVPTYQTARFSFGPGIVYMGAPGTTPMIEIGQTKGDIEVSIKREKILVNSGSPQSLIAQYAVKEDLILKVASIEWNLDNLAYVLGAGETSVSGADEILEFGGDMAMTNRALRLVHRTPDGSTIDFHVFKAEGSGELAIALKESDMHEFPLEFHMLEGTVDFENAALAEKKKKFKIIRTKA